MTATATPPSPEICAQMRLAHLNMIQGIIGRMSGFSATVKNFTVTICAGVIALSFQQHAPATLPFALAFIVLFGFLDAYYLGLEREFRKFYDEVAARPLTAAPDLHIGPEPKRIGRLRSLFGFSVLGFYGPFLVVVALLIYMSPACR